MAVDALSVAKLIIYIILIQPALYCLLKHGRKGLLGWFYVQTFCVLRIVTSALTLNESSTGHVSTTTTILNSVGLSPLLLACAGLLHEARCARNPNINNRLEIFLQVQYHLLAMAALALIVVAVVNLEGGSSSPLTPSTVTTMEDLLKAGAALVILAWVLLAAWCLLSLLWSSGSVSPVPAPPVRVSGAYEYDFPTHADGTVLLWGVAAAVPFNGLRLAYAVSLLLLDIYQPDSSFVTSEAALVVLEVVPEMLSVGAMVVAGVLSRGLKAEFAKVKRDYSSA